MLASIASIRMLMDFLKVMSSSSFDRKKNISPNVRTSSDLHCSRAIIIYLANTTATCAVRADKCNPIFAILEGLKHTDADVRRLYSEITEEKMKNTTERLAGFLQDDTNIREKAYAAIGIMEQHCHMMMNIELYG